MSSLGDSGADTSGLGERRKHESALQLGPKKRPSHSDPLVHHGRHFGRTVHALCNIHVLISSGIRIVVEEIPDGELLTEEKREKKIFQLLCRMVPGFEKRIMTASEERIREIADSLQKGVASARSDDTKSLKGAVLDWITPRGVPLIPPLARHQKLDRGFHHDATGALLCPANLDWNDQEIRDKLRSCQYIVPGDQWPIFLWEDNKYDPSSPWKGLLRSKILICAFKHIFTSPSSVQREPKATRSGNARIHGMTRVTTASLAYVATQVRFALSSASVFSRTDRVSDSQTFYNSVVEFLEDDLETVETTDLLSFWNRLIFPEHFSVMRTITKDSALEKLKERRAIMNQRREPFRGVQMNML